MGNWTVENSRILNCTGGGGANRAAGRLPEPTTPTSICCGRTTSIDTNVRASGVGACLTTYGNNYVFKATVPPGYPDSGTKSYFKVLYNTIQVGTRRRGHAAGRRLRTGRQHMQNAGATATAVRLPVHVSGESQGAVWSNASYNMFLATGGRSPRPATSTERTTSTGTSAFIVNPVSSTHDRLVGSQPALRHHAGPTSSGPNTVPTDILGNTRPCGSAWTLGAYEYGCGGG